MQRKNFALQFNSKANLQCAQGDINRAFKLMLSLDLRKYSKEYKQASPIAQGLKQVDQLIFV